MKTAEGESGICKHSVYNCSSCRYVLENAINKTIKETEKEWIESIKESVELAYANGQKERTKEILNLKHTNCRIVFGGGSMAKNKHDIVLVKDIEKFGGEDDAK